MARRQRYLQQGFRNVKSQTSKFERHDMSVATASSSGSPPKMTTVAITVKRGNAGEQIPITEMDDNAVAMYVQEVKLKFEEVFIPYLHLFKAKKVETIVLEDDYPATGLLRYISEFGIDTLVLGSYGAYCITRKLKGPGVPHTVLKCAPNTCDIRVVFRQRIVSRSANPMRTSRTSHRPPVFTAADLKGSSGGINKHIFDSVAFGRASESEFNYTYLHAFSSIGSSSNASTISPSHSLPPTKSEQAEVEQLRLELQNTVALYKQACKELVDTRNKVQLLSSKCLEEPRRVNAAQEREETFRKIAAEEKAKLSQAMKEVEEAKNLLSKEVYERQMAELNACKESLEKQKLVDTLFCSDRREDMGKSKCSLHGTPVAVKVLQPDALERKEEFLKEVEVLSQLHQPHIVLLLGACPENDRNYVSKIGDFGLAKLISDVAPDNITEYRDSILAGTLYYMDPEYQRTGTVRPKSDIYALGVTILHLLTDWPLAETEELAQIALKCTKLRCRDRPDHDTGVLSILKRLVDVADASLKLEKNNAYASSHYSCSILQVENC
ncbi:UDP-Glycosyltransferase superfamily protein [Hibiscus syriacus]|uniref:RING-type E3 ubiquitin transferase n=1 Tax=Hibiscus syriacus TaxID=106335 RepID=A0A6A2XI59_HIBSY|nr:UDP-Glycosyltransferase superfamily protein [Hibiscus syriacus]